MTRGMDGRTETCPHGFPTVARPVIENGEEWVGEFAEGEDQSGRTCVFCKGVRVNIYRPAGYVPGPAVVRESVGLGGEVVIPTAQQSGGLGGEVAIPTQQGSTSVQADPDLDDLEAASTHQLAPEAHPEDDAPGYEALRAVLDRAYEQAAFGKGRERHANGEPFDQQLIVMLGRYMGGTTAFNIGQACKKSIESLRLDKEPAVTELLGAINYLAAAVILEETRG